MEKTNPTPRDIASAAAVAGLDARQLAEVVRRHAPQGVRSSTSPAVIRAIVCAIRSPRAIPLPSPDPRRAGRPAFAPPTDLPTSLSFMPRPGAPHALDPVYAEGFKLPEEGDDGARSFVRRLGRRCEACGSQRGDLYRHEVRDDLGNLTHSETRAARGNQAAHRTNDPRRCSDADLAALCPICHGYSDAVHRWSAAALSKAAEATGSRLTVTCRDTWLSRGREAAQEAPSAPLAALGVGGAGLLVAHVLDQGLPATPGVLREFLPELAGMSVTDIQLVIMAALTRLRMRGLLHAQRDELLRPLCLPEHVKETPPNPDPAARSNLRARPLGMSMGYAVQEGGL